MSALGKGFKKGRGELSVSDFVDCEQSLFFFRFSKESARARSFACLGRFARRTKKKERLLVVYRFWGGVNLIEASFGFFKDPDGQLSLRVDFHCRVIFTRVRT